MARAFGAVCTPEVFVLDPRGRVWYHGRIDDALVEADVRERYLESALRRVAGAVPRPAPRWTLPLGCTLEYT